MFFPLGPTGPREKTLSLGVIICDNLLTKIALTLCYFSLVILQDHYEGI